MNLNSEKVKWAKPCIKCRNKCCYYFSYGNHMLKNIFYNEPEYKEIPNMNCSLNSILTPPGLCSVGIEETEKNETKWQNLYERLITNEYLNLLIVNKYQEIYEDYEIIDYP